MGSLNEFVEFLLMLDSSLVFDEEWWASTSGLDLDQDYWVSIGIFSLFNDGISVYDNAIENISLGTLIGVGTGSVTGNNYNIVPIPLINIYGTGQNNVTTDISTCYVTTPSIDITECGIDLSLFIPGGQIFPLSGTAYLDIPVDDINASSIVLISE